MNTEYRLFGATGPQVSREATHHSRLDEMAKCLAAAPGCAAVRLFWADAVVSVEGPDLGEWQRWVGKRAPSEQQMVHFMMPNIEAAWRGEVRTRSLNEAKELWYSHGSWDEPAPMCAEVGGQPTPGVFVRRSPHAEGEEWFEGKDQAPRDWRKVTWPTRPTREHVAHFLPGVKSNRWNHMLLHTKPSEAAVGVLLDYSGVDLRFLTRTPLSGQGPEGRQSPEPEACVTILGGPKGMSEAVKEILRESFENAKVPLLEVCLGPEEEMAHACVAFLRLQDDAGLYRAALVDLLRLGPAAYHKLLEVMEAAARGRAGYWTPPIALLEAARSRSPRRNAGHRVMTGAGHVVL